MPNIVTVDVTFPDSTLAASNKDAETLRQWLARSLDPLTRLDVCKDRESTQDAGSILAVTLAAPAIVHLCKGLASYIAARGSSIEVRTRQGTVLARGSAAANIDAAALAAALSAAELET